jgi:hypothetical protein
VAAGTGFRYDLFVSYSPDLNAVPLPDAWVRAFVENLRGAVARRLGRSVSAFYEDPARPGGDEHPDDALRNSHALLMLGTSSWGRRRPRELGIFRTPEDAGRPVLLVDVAPVDRRREPAAEITRFAFHTENARNPAAVLLPSGEGSHVYYEYMDRLARVIADLLAAPGPERKGEPRRAAPGPNARTPSPRAAAPAASGPRAWTFYAAH